MHIEMIDMYDLNIDSPMRIYDLNIDPPARIYDLSIDLQQGSVFT